HQLPLAGAVLDPNGRTEAAREARLEILDVGALLFRGAWSALAGLAMADYRANAPLRLANAPALAQRLLGELLHGGRAWSAEQRAPVAFAQAAVLHERQHRVRQLQEPERIGDRGPILADALGHGLLRQAVLVDQTFEGPGRLDGVEVLALEVLDQGG